MGTYLALPVPVTLASGWAVGTSYWLTDLLDTVGAERMRGGIPASMRKFWAADEKDYLSG